MEKFLLSPNVIIIAGATATGKSKVAMNLAQKIPSTIINGDSVQIYSDLKILTARPNSNDTSLIPHKLYGFIPGNINYSLAQWIQDSEVAIQNSFNQQKIPIIVGGTGLYIKTLMQGLSCIPPIDPEVRKQVRDLISQNIQAGFDMLQKLDEKIASKISQNDSYRIARALEVIISSGKSLLYWQQKNSPINHAKYKFHTIMLSPPRQANNHYAHLRVSKMFSEGAITEVEQMLNNYNYLNKSLDIIKIPIAKALGVKEIQQYLQNKISYEEAIDLVSISTRQYIKRQQTWFKKYFSSQFTFKNYENYENDYFQLLQYLQNSLNIIN